MYDVRPLAAEDLTAAWHLGRLAFGGPAEPRPGQEPSLDQPLSRWGAFDDTGRLVGKAVDLRHEQWWGGQVLQAAGVAGVAVEAEHRGCGATRLLLEALLRAARARGAVVSSLFCTSAAVYRSLGYEVCGELREVDVPASALARIAVPEGIRLRAVDGADWAAVRAVYDEIGRTGNGLLTRRGGLFADPAAGALPDGVDGVTVAETAGGAVVGYASWQRGRGYGADAVLTVLDCLALSADGAAGLLAALASWSTVTPTLRLRPLPWADAVSVRLPSEQLRLHRSDVWMHRPVDVAAAVGARAWPTAVNAAVCFRLADSVLPWNDGAWRMVVGDGRAVLEPTDDDALAVLDVRGWSLLWCGVARSAQLRQAGLLSGGDATTDDALDAVLGCSVRAGVLDYF